MAQWLSICLPRRPPTNVARDQFLDSVSNVGESIVSSCPFSERFFSRYSGFPLSSKTNISKFQFELEFEGHWVCQSDHTRDLKHRRRGRQRERQKTIVLISKTLALHVHCTLWYISLPSSAKQRREMTKFKVLWRT